MPFILHCSLSPPSPIFSLFSLHSLCPYFFRSLAKFQVACFPKAILFNLCHTIRILIELNWHDISNAGLNCHEHSVLNASIRHTTHRQHSMTLVYHCAIHFSSMSCISTAIALFAATAFRRLNDKISISEERERNKEKNHIETAKQLLPYSALFVYILLLVGRSAESAIMDVLFYGFHSRNNSNSIYSPKWWDFHEIFVTVITCKMRSL